MNPGLQQIVDFLGKNRVRATYGAVGQALGLPGRAIGGMLGERRPEVSWVVNAETGLPTGYSEQEIHPALTSNDVIIGDGLILLQRMLGIQPSSNKG